MFDCCKSDPSAFSESKPWPVVAGLVSDLATLTIHDCSLIIYFDLTSSCPLQLGCQAF